MAREVVQDPIPFPESFRETGDAAAQSQAAVLLTLGNLLRFEDPFAMELMAEEQPPPEPEEILPEEDRQRLNIPAGIYDLARVRGVRFDANFIRERVAGREAVVSGMAIEEAGTSLSLLPALAERLHAEPSQPLAAAELLQASLSHPDELVRVAAASSYAEVALPQQQAIPIRILAEGTRSEDETTRDVAATALARLVPGHPRLRELVRPEPYSVEGEPTHTSTMIHGTWARNQPWWKPGGDFHTYIRSNVDPNLYSAGDFYSWSGDWSDAGRADGALRLIQWVNDHQLDGLDLFAHSHGGNVAMLANKTSLRIGRLVMMACPVHRRKYFPEFTRVNKVVAIVTHMDLVILADGGGQRFNDARIQEIILPLWFTGHSKTHDPEIWRRHDLPARI
ncbi:MAG TPA: hypothetical protein VF789_25095 [Thermoanaerobaculia bacterium]